ncbi:MAG: DUF4325 domain-containing protein [Candidatus Nealsonbacteria bacterium]|nr:DUF4325 domain-containing protein [Candidatus Nealsonbacteria bacterium]
MLTKEGILKIAKKEGKILTKDIARHFGVSRQYASSLISGLADERHLIKIGKTRGSFYVSPAYAQKNKDIIPNYFSQSFSGKNLEEHKVLEQIENSVPNLKRLPENIYSIFTYAFSEMLNNAIEHSRSEKIFVEVNIQDSMLLFQVRDYGIGVFKNVMKQRKLKSELEAIQDLLKGKTTTTPKSHSGEGIFFTSKVGDVFSLESFDRSLIVDNTLPDIFVEKPQKLLNGTLVKFRISVNSKRHLNDIFQKFTSVDRGDYGFDKTEIYIKLYTLGGVHVSRSQARRVLLNLDKFKTIIFDYDKVPVVGQAFADEIYRVFQEKHPEIMIESTNMNEEVKFMVERAKALGRAR